MDNGNTTDIINPIPAALQNILLQLNVIASIEKGQKLNIGNMSIIDANSWIGSLMRSISGEGRKHLLSYLNTLILLAIQSIQDYHKTEFKSLIVNTLAKAKKGIMNLAVTYQSDHNATSGLNILIENINIQLSKHDKIKHGELFHDST